MRLLLLLALAVTAASAEPPSVSGIYPSLAMFNDEGECGTGAVVPFADRLWVVTYGPHLPLKSSDRLYEITPGLEQIVRPESVGGTCANRMIHRESNQLFIGRHVIGADRQVRTIAPPQMFGRLTANARHLFDPAGKIYCATMEEGLYEIDVKTLGVTELWADEQVKKGRHADLPGYHGKGLYSGQGRVVYANNGDHAQQALSDPTIPSGVLASWDGKADAFEVVRRNQFTDITGPGGIYGNTDPAHDPLWAIGWDNKSLILMLLEAGQWHSFRLPKASNSYDGAHGWNTEWPRIREIGEGDDFLMTMHGTFWHFPKGFRLGHTAGIAPRSNYLKIIGDFCRWNDRVVCGCDDTAKSEFLNKRIAKGELKGPGQSHSNLWFVKPEQLDHLGPAIGCGSVWLREPVKGGAPSDPFLFAGYRARSVWLHSGTEEPAEFTIETDDGTGTWTELQRATIKMSGNVEFPAETKGAWIRVRAGRDLEKASAVFNYSNLPAATAPAPPQFSPLIEASGASEKTSTGRLLVRGNNLRTLAFAAVTPDHQEALYELNGDLELKRSEDAAALKFVKDSTPIPADAFTSDDASILFVDESTQRWRLPKTTPEFEKTPPLRVCREVMTERDLLQVHGTFYELPARNAGGFSKIRPITTHTKLISDYASYRGLLVLAGLDLAKLPAAGAGLLADSHVVRSEDGQAALWVGAVDDLWQLGAPHGHGGPWHNTAVKAHELSDPYLFRGYAQRRLALTIAGPQPARISVLLDITGQGDWVFYKSLNVPPDETIVHDFSPALGGYWLRLRSETETQITAELTYK